LQLKAAGGAPPFLWFINGQPLGKASARRTAEWTPDGIGFAEVSVMDAGGRTESVSIRLQ
ncbi:MAG: hypothetical protein ACKVON_03640, partial [Beijerinckiaceae bacterium]